MNKNKIINGQIKFGITSWSDKEVFYLDHSCDEWVIGDIEEAKKFANDLLETIKEIEVLNSPINSDNL